MVAVPSLTGCWRVQGWQHASAPPRNPLPPFLMQAASPGPAQGPGWSRRAGRGAPPGFSHPPASHPHSLSEHTRSCFTADTAHAALGKLLPWQTTGSVASAWLTMPGLEVGATLPCTGLLGNGGVGCASDLSAAGR